MEEAPPDWDLLAVVRSCNTTSTSTSTSTPPPQQHEHHHHPLPTYSPTSPPPPPPGPLFRFPNPFDPPAAATTSFQELHEICNAPLICTTTNTTGGAATSTSCCVAASSATTSFQTAALASPVASSPFSIAGRSFLVDEQTVVRRPVKTSQVVFGAPSASTNAASSSQAQRTKKRKNLMKKVCHVPAEGLSSDMWAWRKYGQKPIKGSPYPRGYYRCSSSKGCLARKQVERNRSDPKMFIVTYTAEHNHPMPTHRNSLAGSTRQKPLPSSDPAGETPAEQPTCSSPSALSPATEKNDADEAVKDEMEEDNEMGISDLMLNDDFYVEFEQIDGGDEGECFSDHFSLPWLSSNSGTATAAGGS